MAEERKIRIDRATEARPNDTWLPQSASAAAGTLSI